MTLDEAATNLRNLLRAALKGGLFEDPEVVGAMQYSLQMIITAAKGETLPEVKKDDETKV